MAKGIAHRTGKTVIADVAIAQHGVRWADDFIIVRRQYGFAAKALSDANQCGRQLVVDIMKVHNIRALLQQQGVEFIAGLSVVDKVDARFELARQPVALMIIHVMYEEAFPGRRLIFRMLHAEVDNLIARLQHGVSLLEKNGFRSALNKKEFINE